MPDPLLTLALVFACLALVFFGFAVRARRDRHKRVRRMATRGTLGLLMLVTALLFGTLTVSTWGYHALTHEVVVLEVTTTRTGPQRFDARVEFPDGNHEIYPLRGDEVYVDARILKWKPAANLLGLHAEYELDRIAGRYTSLEDERSRPRTVYPLGTARPLDLFELRRSYPLLAPLVDAEYGSGTFVPVEDRASFEVLLSTSGLLVRPSRQQEEAETTGSVGVSAASAHRSTGPCGWSYTPPARDDEGNVTVT